MMIPVRRSPAQWKKHVLFLLACTPTLAWAGLENDFMQPPDSACPGVYWYFLNGNLNGREMTADLESMKAAGLGNLIFLEVDLGAPPGGPVAFMSPTWQDLFVQAVRDAERLGLDITLGIGPGWCGSGGPWVRPEQAMQHLVFSSVDVQGPQRYSAALPLPEQRSTEFHKLASPFYEDVVVWAFPSREPLIADINDKALYERGPYTIWMHVRPHLSLPARFDEPAPDAVIQPDQLLDLTPYLQPNGTLDWNVPPGRWTIVRMGRRVTGASTRPAPSTAIGLECDRFDVNALEAHLEHFVGQLLRRIGPRTNTHGLNTLHMDSWESGAQNWTPSFLEQFKQRRGYDARPWLPVLTGRVIRSLEMSERFLWDLRLTAQELVLENHAEAVKKYARQHGLQLSIEPYDMNPAGDLDLGAVADVPMAEFWNNTFNSAYSVFEATSIAHVLGKPIVAAEAFTSVGAIDAYPWSLKKQGDWALCVGINRFVFHTFPHQTLGDAFKPGMTFGPYGVHWHRNQTWWPMVAEYHRYLARCSMMLRQGTSVADVLYLTPEGAPTVFVPPSSALEGEETMPDKKGYGFDGCSPRLLMANAKVNDGEICFPGGASYRLLVLPLVERMTPALLAKIRDLVDAGATVVGLPPVKSPSLMGYPACDDDVRSVAQELWGSLEPPPTRTQRQYGKGRICWGGELSQPDPAPRRDKRPYPPVYPSYEATAAILRDMGVKEDFVSTGPVRYGHRRTKDLEIYFVANRTAESITVDCRFRDGEGQPHLWDAVTGERRPLPQFTRADGVTAIPLEFAPLQSFFVVFDKATSKPATLAGSNFPKLAVLQEVPGEWEVAFDPAWGGPDKVVFDSLQDWTTRPEPGIKHYSGIATYRKTIRLEQIPTAPLCLDLGNVCDMARVWLNGQNLGVVWCAPWRINLTGVLKPGDNELVIEVANRWPNRMIGDKQPADANVRTVSGPDGFLGGQSFKAGRYTFCTHDPYNAQSPLLPSGLLGPVRILVRE